MLRMRSLMTFVILLSFGSCFSLKDQGLWSDVDSTNLKAIGFHRKLLVRNNKPSRKIRPATVTPPTSPAPSPSPTISLTVAVAVAVAEQQNGSSTQVFVSPPPSVPLANSPTSRSSSDGSVLVPLVIGCVSAAVFILLVASGFYFFRSKSEKSVNPWRTGLSGQLQKAFVTGIPVLKKSEIEAACEDFSNVIGSCPTGKLFKGTLSSGVEIAVAYIATTSAKDWKDKTEVHFRNKIEMLSKINHKNFVNLIGSCEENEPFTRILIFEYAPNGSLFEHLQDKESEHLDWGMRLRIAMGLAYCLDHMHQLNPPIAHTSLVSSSLQLTEDYAVKVADFSFGPSETETRINNTIIDTCLAWETQSETLRRHFEQYGEILEAVVIADKNTGRSKGYGFVTFRDPEAARRACVDPTPIIDGRRANCNLASLGRPRPPLPYALIPNMPGRLRLASPYIGNVQGPRGSLVGNYPYQQPLPYNYQQGVIYPYGVTPYGSEYMYSQSQGLYSPYMGQQYLQVYGVPGAVNSPVYQYGQLSQTIPSGHGYTAVQGYSVPGSHVLQLGGPTVSGMTTSSMSALQAPYPSGIPGPAPVQSHIIVHSPQFMPSSGSDQTTSYS